MIYSYQNDMGIYLPRYEGEDYRREIGGLEDWKG
jgi:cell wall-associated NlpC family hydrolase